MLRTYASVARSRAFRAYTLSAAATYASLFAFVRAHHLFLSTFLARHRPSSRSFATMVVGYLIGTVICRRLLAMHGIQRTVCAGASLQAAAGVTMALALSGVHVPIAIGAPMFSLVCRTV